MSATLKMLRGKAVFRAILSWEKTVIVKKGKLKRVGVEIRWRDTFWRVPHGMVPTHKTTHTSHLGPLPPEMFHCNIHHLFLPPNPVKGRGSKKGLCNGTLANLSQTILLSETLGSICGHSALLPLLVQTSRASATSWCHLKLWPSRFAILHS